MQKIAILYDASQAVLSTFDLDEVSEHILRIMRDYFQLQHGAILLLNPATGDLETRSVTGATMDECCGRVRIGEGLVGSAAKLKLPVYSQDVSKDPRYVPIFASTRSELAIPLMLRDEVAGVLDCQSDHLNFFDNETTDLLTLFSTQASIAIQNAQLYALEQRRAKQLEAINMIARQTTAVTDIDKLLADVTAQIMKSFRADAVCIFLQEEGKLVPRACQGNLTPLFSIGEPVASVRGICKQAIAHNTPMLVQDVKRESAYEARFKETGSELLLPLVSFGETIGTLALESAVANGFHTEDIKPLESVADICAAAIQNARYFQKVKQQADRDGLTGGYNRRFFENRILEELDRAKRYRTPLSVLMVDVDNFKKLNDEFGHLLGDEVLKQVSRLFMENTRKSDVVCRYGGDEIAVMVTETPGPNALRVAEKLRATVSKWEFPGVPRPVTLSIGIAEFPLHGATRDEIIKAADQALYVAKQEGRNRAVLFATASRAADD
jgi:diguanylate cyclase (GGDEF)-like protein